MTHVVKRLKLNKFRAVSIPKNKDLFMRIGRRPLPAMADGQIASYNSNTMDVLSDIEAQILKENQMSSDTHV